MYSRSAKGGEEEDPNRNPWLAKMMVPMHIHIFLCMFWSFFMKMIDPFLKRAWVAQ